MLMLEPHQITALREGMRLSRKDFAKQLEVSEACLCRWEKGVRHPKYEKMKKLNELANDLHDKAKAAAKRAPVPA